MSGSGFDKDVHNAAATPCSEVHRASGQSEQGVIATATDVVARMEVGPALTDDDLAGLHLLPTETFDTEPLRIGVATVTS